MDGYAYYPVEVYVWAEALQMYVKTEAWRSARPVPAE